MWRGAGAERSQLLWRSADETMYVPMSFLSPLTHGLLQYMYLEIIQC